MAAKKITCMPHATVKEGREEEFIAEMKRAALSVHANEEGCLAFKLYRRKDNPRQFIIFEQYQDKLALAKHVNHMRELFGQPTPESDPLPAKIKDFYEQDEIIFWEEVIE